MVCIGNVVIYHVGIGIYWKDTKMVHIQYKSWYKFNAKWNWKIDKMLLKTKYGELTQNIIAQWIPQKQCHIFNFNCNRYIRVYISMFILNAISLIEPRSPVEMKNGIDATIS